jgi:pimeloyl-ACP methyl ester carboxylesterase
MKVIASIAAAIAFVALAIVGSLRAGWWNPTLDTLKARYAEPPSRFIDVDGVPFHIRDEGQGPPLILLNGHLGNLHMFDGWVPILTPHVRLIRLDYPPYGLSGPDPTGDYSTERSVYLLGKLIDQLGLERVNVGGTSNGALVAAVYAIRNPDRVDKLVVSTLPTGRPPRRSPSEAMMQASSLNRWAKPYQTHEFYRAFLRDVFARPDRVTEPLVRQYADINNRAGGASWVDAYIQTQYKLWDTTDVAALFGQMRTPTLLQWGDGGKVLPPFVGDAVRDLLVNAPLTMIRYPDAGHMPMLELPERTAQDVLSFLTGTVAPGR